MRVFPIIKKQFEGGPPAPVDPVEIGPEFGQSEALTVGADVSLQSLDIGPANTSVGVAATFESLDLGPFSTLSAGAAVSFNELRLGAFAAPSVGAAVSGSLFVSELRVDEDTWLDENDATAHGTDVTLVARTDTAIGGEERRIYMAWDLTGYAGTTVTNFNIRLYCRTTGLTNEQAPWTLWTHPTKPFEEDTATWANTEPPPGTQRASGNISANTSYAQQVIATGSGAWEHLPGNWVYVRILGNTALGLADINVISKETGGNNYPYMDLWVDL